MKVSIFDLVVGDIVQLNIGDQVSVKSFRHSFVTFIEKSMNLLSNLLTCAGNCYVLLVILNWNLEVESSKQNTTAYYMITKNVFSMT